MRMLERKLQRRDEALEEQDAALEDAHRSILDLKEQEASLVAKLKAAEKRIGILERGASPSPRGSPMSSGGKTPGRSAAGRDAVSRTRQRFRVSTALMRLDGAAGAVLETRSPTCSNLLPMKWRRSKRKSSGCRGAAAAPR